MNSSKYIKIITPELSSPAKSFLLGDILNGFGNGIMNVVLQLYFISLGFDSLTLGTASMLQAIGQAIFTLPSGYLTDRYGKRKMMIIGFAFGSSLILWVLSTNTWILFLGYFLIGGCNAVLGVVLYPLYSSFFNQADMDRAFGIRGFLSIIARSTGSLFGFLPPLLVSRYGYSLQNAYWATLVLAVVFCLAPMPFYLSSSRGLTETKHQGKFEFNLKSRRIVAKFGFIFLITNLGFGVFFNLFPFYVNKKYGIGSDALGVLYFASNLLMAGASILAPKVSARIGSLRTIILSYCFCVAFWLMFTAAPSFTVLSALYCFRFFFGSMMDPIVNSLYMKLLYVDERSTAVSITTMASMGGGIIGPWLGGALMNQVSLDIPIYLGSALYALTAASYFVLIRNEKLK